MAAVWLLLWILTLLVSFIHSNGLHIYEVVRPIRLHDLHKRAVEPTRPDTVKYAMSLGGRHVEMHLKKSSDFVTEDYTETHYLSDGIPVVTKPDAMDLCYYQGKIKNDRNSLVSVSTCDGLRGYFQTAEQKYVIEPLSEGADGDHAVMKYEDVIESPPAVCGVTNTTWLSEGFPGTSRGKSKARTSGQTMSLLKKYNEVILVVDHGMYVKMDKSLLQVRQKVFDILNFVNAVYKPLNTFVALIGLEIWTDTDKIVVSSNAGDTLSAFTTWRNNDLIKRQNHDNAHLITEIDFEGATIGLGYVGALCTDSSTAVIQDHNIRAIAVGATLSHEMGHNLGMNHDSSSCACAGNSCIMAAYLSYDIPQLFSNCSLINYEQFQNSRNPECLLNKPQAKDLLQPAVCGNGFKETGEDCDCGSVADCTNPCCNASTCTLTKGSICSDGECCQNCRIADATLLCRPQHDECDLPEYCTGNSSLCPEDVFSVNGLPCRNSTGYCYNGRCPKREDQCVKMWGSGAVVGIEFCYKQNTRGTYFAYCTRPTNEQYVGCQTQDVMCGKLFCDQGQSSPLYGRSVSFNSCKATFYTDRTQDFGQVNTGTKCGEGKVCNKNQCVSLDAVYNAANCSAKCNGNRVCNHKLQCTCAPEWLPPDCMMPASKSQSMDTSSQIGIAVAIVILLGAVLVGVAIYCMKCRTNRSSSARANRSQTSAVKI